MIKNKEILIELINFKKWYEKELILDIPSLIIEKGISYVLVGGNGSGKSTLIKSILGFLNYQGTITLHTSSIAFLPERIQKIDFLTIEEYLNLILKLNEKTIQKQILSEYFEYFDLNPSIKVQNCSKGMFQKMNLILTFSLDKELIILDEPLNGLDPKTQEKLIELIRKQKEEGKTFIITTHYKSIYENCYDKVIQFLHKGVEVE